MSASSDKASSDKASPDQASLSKAGADKARPGEARPDKARPGKASSGNRNPEVDAWFEGYDNPQASLVQRVRRLILEASPEVTEAIKWQAPTFVYRGNIASFYPKSKKHVSLMFHQGASLPDPAGLLEGSGDTSRVAKFLDADDLAAKADALQDLIRAWVSAHS